MPTIAFDEWVTPDLTLTLRGHAYTVCPPSVDLAKDILVYYLAITGQKLTESQDKRLGELSDLGVAESVLGNELVAQMAGDGIPKSDIDRLAVYTVAYWARGKKVADAIVSYLANPPTPRESETDEAPKAPKSGQPTESAPQMRTASTPTTDTQPTSPGPNKHKSKATSSTGPTSSPTGTPSSPTS